MKGQEINTYLLRKAMNQKDFAKRIDTAQGNVSRWIKSNTKLSNSSINKILKAFPDFDAVVTGEYKMDAKVPASVVQDLAHQYNIKNRLTVLNVNDLEDFMNGRAPKKGEIDVSDFIEATGSMMMKGDEMGGSMTVNGGDVLAHKEWKPRDYYDYGKIHIVCTSDYFFVRYLKKHESKDKVILRAKNEFYDDIDLPISEIKKVFVVSGAVVRS